MKKKFVGALLGAMLALGAGLFHSPPAFAETVEAEGEYIMGDGTEENQGVAKERARKQALRNAGETACVLVETFAESIDGELTRDEIRTISANVLRVISAPIRPVVVGDVIKFVCHITVEVEKENVLNYINSNSKMQIDESMRRIKELEAENARINEELAALKKRAAGASESERLEINTAIKRNEKEFTALQYTEQGSAFYDKREYNKAVEVLNKAIELNPEYSNAWAWLGAVCNDLGNTDKAIGYNQKAIALDPKNALAWNNLGVSYNYLGDNKKSIEYYRKAAQLDPKLLYPFGNLGRIYAETGEFDKALEYANKAVSLNPKHSFAWIALGEALQAKGDFQKSLESYQKAVGCDSRNQLAWTFLGDGWLNVNNPSKAAECFNRALELLRDQTKLYPEDSLCLSNIGGVYLRLKKYDDAVMYFRKSLEMNPNFADVWTSLGFVYFGAENYDEALKAFTKSVELAPNKAEVWAALGYTYFKTENYNEALKSFNKAVELAPNNQEFRTARDTLAAYVN